MNYSESGVDISKGNEFIESIKSTVESTSNYRVISSIGDFGGYYDISNLSVENPVLVSSTDGVGSKLKLATKFNKYDTIGIDLVAMVANDIIVSGAKPLFFLDYYATGHLDIKIGKTIIQGIVNGCNQAGMALLGGETAELRSIYHGHDFDLAGFGVGVVDTFKIILPSHVNHNDAIIGLRSSGPHSNGYSLINQIFDFDRCDQNTINQLMEPTKIYVTAIKELLKVVDVHGIAHITGGGLTENIPRILPHNMNAVIKLGTWTRPEIFNHVQDLGKIEDDEMLRVFNCGIGMAIIVDQTDVDTAMKTLNLCNEKPILIGHVIRSLTGSRVIYS